MAKIRKLSSDTIQKIAAGEVIERPASVVKELVENSIDAHASRIEIKIQDYPSYTITITDDGDGMGKKDIQTCLEPFSTSKISEFEDLYDVGSYGFRGEALSSINAVARVSVKSQQSSDGEGWKYKSGEVTPCVMAPGTRIEVADLFYNTPARKKFLKAPNTEKGYISAALEELALAASDVSLQFEYNGRLVFSLAASSLENRIKTVFKNRWFKERSRFFIVEDSLKGGSLWALCSEPSLVCPTSKYTSFYVNDRAIKDRVLSSAVKSAYATASERGSWPYVVLFLNLSGSEVDVNVHPAKKEVRFKDTGLIHQWVASAVKKGIQKHQATVIGDHRVMGLEFRAQSQDKEVAPIEKTFSHQPSAISSNLNIKTSNSNYTLHSAQSEIKRKYSDLTILGQIKQTYIVCEANEKMILVDQHAAHERVEYEKLLADYKRGSLKKQLLLVPEQVELSDTEIVTVDRFKNIFEKIGFELSLFSGRTLMVKAVPTIATSANPRALLHEILAELEDQPEGDILPQYLHQIFATIACHSVIRAHQLLSDSEMRALLKQLDDLEFTQCPHGRPIAIDFPFKDLEKRFKRT